MAVLNLTRSTSAVVSEGADLVFYRRLYVDSSGTLTPITQALTSTVTYKVFDNPTATTPSATGSLVVATVIFDTLQTGTVWTTFADSTGYNFRAIMARSLFPDGNKRYTVEITVTLTSGYQFPVVFEIETALNLQGE